MTRGNQRVAAAALLRTGLAGRDRCALAARMRVGSGRERRPQVGPGCRHRGPVAQTGARSSPHVPAAEGRAGQESVQSRLSY